MSFLQGALLVSLAAGATAVVLTRDPLRQTIVAGVYGLLLGLLFFVVEAPDVALSEIVVASVAIPALLLLTLSKLAQLGRSEGDDG